MNMINPENFEELRRDAQPNPALARLMKAWEDRMSKNAKRAAGFGLVAVSLAACGSSTTDPDPVDPVDPDPEGRTVFLTNWAGAPFANALAAIPAGFLFDFATAGEALAFFRDIEEDVNAVPTLTTDTSNITINRLTTTDGDDTIILTNEMFNGVFIDGGEGDDALEMDVISGGLFRAIGVVNVQNVLISNQAPLFDPVIGVLEPLATIDLFSVLDLESLTITQDQQGLVGTTQLDVTGIRNAADVTFSGSFDNGLGTSVAYVQGVAAINVTFHNVTASDPFTISHEGGTVNLFTTGDIAVNVIDDANLGQFLRTLNISGETPLELGVETNPLVMRASAPARIDASNATDLRLNLAQHDDVTFIGNDGDNYLAVVTGANFVGTGIEDSIRLDVDFGGGANTLQVGARSDAGATALQFVSPGSQIVSDGTVDLLVGLTAVPGVLANVIISFVDPFGAEIDMSSISTVLIGQSTTLDLTWNQVDTIGVPNFTTPDFVNQTGLLNITRVSDEVVDLSDLDVGQVVGVTTIPGDVVLNVDTVLGNPNTGIVQLVVDNRGQDSSVTMTGLQFAQMDTDQPIITSTSQLGVLGGTNNPVTGQTYTTALTIVDPAEDQEIDLGGVVVDDTTIVLGDGFTADGDFDIDNTAGTTELTLRLEGEVDISDGTVAGVDNVVIADGAVVTLSGAQVNAFVDNVTFEGEATVNIIGDNVDFQIDSDVAGDMSAVTINFLGDGVTAGADVQVTITGSSDLTIKGITTGPDVDTLTIDNDLAAGATLTISGGSPAIDLGPEATELTIDSSPRTITVIGSEAGTPSIIGASVTDIDLNPGAEATIDLGVLGITSTDLTITNNNPDEAVTLEIAEVPAGALWIFDGVNVEINEGATFGLGAEIRLDPGTTISGTFDFSQLPLAQGSILPISADFSADAITTLLAASPLNSVTVNATDMTIEQLRAVVAQSQKINTISGDVFVTNELTAEELDKLVADYAPALGDEFTADAAGMSSAQLIAIAPEVTIALNLTVTNAEAAVLDDLLGAAPAGTAIVDADGMGAGALGDVADNITNVSVINNMTIPSGVAADDITRLLTKSPAGETVIDADGMSNTPDPQYTAIVEQIGKVSVIENLEFDFADNPPTVTDPEFLTLLENAVDVNVDAGPNPVDPDELFSIDRLKVIAENIDRIEDEGISNLTITNDFTPAEIDALMSKTVDGEVAVNLAGMEPAQIAAVIANIEKVDDTAVSVPAGTTVTLTAAQLKAFNDEGIAVEGDPATVDDPTGGSVTVTHAGGGVELDFTLVNAGTDGGVPDANPGTLTFDIAGGTVRVEGPEAKFGQNIVVTGSGVWTIGDGVTLSGSSVDLGSDITVRIGDASVLTLSAEDASAATVGGTTFQKFGTGILAADGGFAVAPATEKDLSGLNLSAVDELSLQDLTVLPTNGALLPGQIGTVPGGPNVVVQANSNWSAYTGDILSDVVVEENATLTLSVTTAAVMGPGRTVTGDPASDADQTGGSVIVVGLGSAEVDLSGIVNWSAGAESAPGDDNAGVFSIAIAGNVVLNEATVLPATGVFDNHSIDIPAGSSLTVNATEGTQAQNNYSGAGTLRFQDLDGPLTVNAGDTSGNSDGVRNVDFVFDKDDSDVTIDGWASIGGAVFNGRFIWDDDPDNPILGLMRLDVSDFDTNGTGEVVFVDNAGALANPDVANTGVLVISDITSAGIAGAFGNGAVVGYGTALGDIDEFFIVVEGAAGTVDVWYWEDDGAGANSNNGIVDNDELELVATLNADVIDNLADTNFVV